MARNCSRTIVQLAGIALLALAAGGCGPRNFTNENDRLRRENLELQRQAQQMQETLEQRVAQIQAMEQRLEATTTAPAVEGVGHADLPRINTLRLGKFSGTMDADQDGSQELLRIYVQTLDQKGRFIPAIGQALVQVVAVPEGQPPIELGQRLFTAQEFDAAYRSGMAGTHYTLEFTLDKPVPKEVAQVLVKLNFTDAATGVKIEHQQNLGRGGGR